MGACMSTNNAEEEQKEEARHRQVFRLRYRGERVLLLRVCNVSHYTTSDFQAGFFDEVSRTCAPGYLPNEMDVLRARTKTTGIYEARFQMRALSIHLEAFSHYPADGAGRDFCHPVVSMCAVHLGVASRNSVAMGIVVIGNWPRGRGERALECRPFRHYWMAYAQLVMQTGCNIAVGVATMTTSLSTSGLDPITTIPEVESDPETQYEFVDQTQHVDAALTSYWVFHPSISGSGSRTQRSHTASGSECGSRSSSQTAGISEGAVFAEVQVKNVKESDDAANAMVDAFKLYKQEPPESSMRMLKFSIQKYCKTGDLGRSGRCRCAADKPREGQLLGWNFFASLVGSSRDRSPQIAPGQLFPHLLRRK
ncbi:guanine nucleotide-binding protein alpha-3 subunit [Apiospora hydei]|uniref:Guanine nucleotide-binding protein alpha-3 subunit n=1 Tax=Apiospora hydei TaxID=1337664 RepID=A0ABR1XBC8_9PEZI